MLEIAPILQSLLAPLAKALAVFFLWLASITSPTQNIPISSGELEIKTELVSTSTEVKPAVKTEKIKTPKQKVEPAIEETPVAAAVEAPIRPIDPSTLIPSATLNEKARGALINIICTTTRGGSFQPITASGVFIDPRGIILTNAHAAQYLLLSRYAPQYGLSCVGRTGSPAYPRYTLDLLYLPPSWVAANKENIIKENPTGTGEFDFALLYVSGAVGTNNLPASFNYIPPSTSEPSLDATLPYLLAGYPAGFLSGIFVQNNLYASSATLTPTEFATFGETDIDLISFGGSVLAQKGASGGPAVDSEKGELAGIMVTIASAAQTGDRDLRIVTLAHMNRAIKQTEGVTLTEFISGNISERAADFSRRYATLLTQQLIDVIER